VMLITKLNTVFDAGHRYALFHIKCVIYHFLRPRARPIPFDMTLQIEGMSWTRSIFEKKGSCADD